MKDPAFSLLRPSICTSNKWKGCSEIDLLGCRSTPRCGLTASSDQLPYEPRNPLKHSGLRGFHLKHFQLRRRFLGLYSPFPEIDLHSRELLVRKLEHPHFAIGRHD